MVSYECCGGYQLHEVGCKRMRTIQERIDEAVNAHCLSDVHGGTFKAGASLMLSLILEELRIPGHVFVMNNYDMADWIEKRAKE
jgi:hypothetical protein